MFARNAVLLLSRFKPNYVSNASRLYKCIRYVSGWLSSRTLVVWVVFSGRPSKSIMAYVLVIALTR